MATTFPKLWGRERRQGRPAEADRPCRAVLVLGDGPGTALLQGPAPSVRGVGGSGVLSQKSMPPMPPSPPGMAGAAFSGLSAMTASVVRKSAAMEAAFCSAERVTLAGSMIPL